MELRGLAIPIIPVIGVNALDYSGYPDCRPEYISAFQKMANLGTKNGQITIYTPLISMTKADIIRLGLTIGVDYSKTSSCYDPIEAVPCGKCDSCLLRKKGFDEVAENPDLLEKFKREFETKVRN